MGTECKEMSRETENSPPARAKIHSAWNYTSMLFICHCGMGIMHSNCKVICYISKVKKLGIQIRAYYNDSHGYLGKRV